MQFEFLVNGGVSLLLSPENDAEIALLKKMMQQDNDFTELRSKVHVLNKSFQGGVLIASRHKSPGKIDKPEEDSDASLDTTTSES